MAMGKWSWSDAALVRLIIFWTRSIPACGPIPPITPIIFLSSRFKTLDEINVYVTFGE